MPKTLEQIAQELRAADSAEAFRLGLETAAGVLEKMTECPAWSRSIPGPTVLRAAQRALDEHERQIQILLPKS